MNIVLFEPDIPQNTGNIVRLCACTGSKLYLVGKLGFLLTDKHLKRAGLDYWHDMDITKVDSLEELELQHPQSNFYYLSTKASRIYTEISFKKDDFLVFGSETKGLPEHIVFNNPLKSIKIPMAANQRSLNLANSVAIVLYEGLRQAGFELF